jgi:uronate dehydrogenase
MASLQTMSIAITGGSGRVGTALREILAPQCRSIHIIDIVPPAKSQANERYMNVDTSRLDDLAAAFEGVDGIIHLAGLPTEKPIGETLKINLLGVSNVYEAARLKGVGRVVLGSSNHASGFYPRDRYLGPDAPMRPDSLYGLSKCWAELTAGLYFDKAGIRTLVVRIGNAQDRPTSPRSLEIWISPGDLAQLCTIGLVHPDVDCTTVYGVSAGGGSWYDNSLAERLGYKPADRIVDFATPEAFRPQATELPEIAETFQGGPFCVWGHDGALRRRPRS